MALPRGATGLSAVCDCGHTHHTHLLFLGEKVGNVLLPAKCVSSECIERELASYSITHSKAIL